LGLLEVNHYHFSAIVPGRNERGFIAKVRQVSAAKACSAPGEDGQVDIGGQA
jgi:hypothetical protein